MKYRRTKHGFYVTEFDIHVMDDYGNMISPTDDEFDSAVYYFEQKA
jgi:hypothetical protein